MQRSTRLVIFSCLVIAAFFSTGCIDKTFYPATELEITSVTPYEVIPTATDTASLPTVLIAVKSISKIPCSLNSFSIKYFTSLGDEISSLAANSVPMNYKIDGEATLDVEMRPYTTRLVDIFELSSSQISPVTAKITLNFDDINGNFVSREAHCLLYKVGD